MKRSSRPALASSLAALTALLAATTSPVSAAAGEEREPSWTSTFAAEDPYDTSQWIGDSVVDPASGDVLTLVHNSDHAEKRRLRRIDGATGETRWEVGLSGPGGSTTLQLALDPEGGRAAVAVDASGRTYLHSVGLDGEVAWSKVLEERGALMDLEVNPATGQSCHTSDRSSNRRRGRPGGWALTCLDRAGDDVTTKLAERRYGRGEPTALTADPSLDRWYVAGTQGTKRGSRTVLLSYAQGSKRLWRRALEHRAGGSATAEALVVDPASHRIHLGGSSQRVTEKPSGRRSYVDRPHLVAWSAGGKQRLRRTWADGRGGSVVSDLALARTKNRIFATTTRRNGAIDLRIMDGEGRLVRKVEHEGRGSALAHVEIDVERRLVLVAGRRVAAYDWKGARQWRSPSDNYFVFDLDLDPARGRVVAAWMEYDDPGAPDAWVSGWTL